MIIITKKIIIVMISKIIMICNYNLILYKKIMIIEVIEIP